MATLLRGYFGKVRNLGQRIGRGAVDFGHSPLHKNIFNTQEKRSELFNSRSYIPGRKWKAFLVGGVFGLIFGTYKYSSVQLFLRLRTLEITTYERKAVPFLQAMADQRFLGLEDRKKMAWDAVLRGLGSDASHKEATRYETELDTFAPFEYRSTFQNTGHIRNTRDYFDNWKMRMTHAGHIENI